MKKNLLYFLFLLFSATLSFSQQVFVAVAPFEARDGISASNAMTITEIFTIELQATGQVRIVTRTNFDAMMKEHRFQLSDLSDNKKTAQLGKALSANWVVRGQLQRLGALIVITATLMDVNTTEVVGGAPMYLNKIEEAPEKIPSYMETIKQRIKTGTKVYKPGDIGPAGGIVFYDKGSFSNGWRFLEAAPPETEFKAEWGAYGQNIAGTQEDIGYGKRNTDLIVEQLRKTSETGRAAQLCVTLNFDGFTDWFLPSRNELSLMSKQGILKSGNYWSSSQTNQNNAFSQSQDNAKYNSYLVRAIRAF